MPPAGSVYADKLPRSSAQEDMSRTQSSSPAPCSQLQCLECGYRKGRVESKEDMLVSIFKSKSDCLCLLSREMDTISHFVKQFRSRTRWPFSSRSGR